MDGDIGTAEVAVPDLIAGFRCLTQRQRTLHVDELVGDIGAQLRTAREQRGIGLREIANSTKISMTALAALERNDFERLPGGLFTRAYIRSFASEVGLNPEEITRQYCARFERNPSEQPLVLPGIAQDQRPSRMRALAVVAVGLAVLIYGPFSQKSSEDPPPRPASVPLTAVGELAIGEAVAVLPASAPYVMKEPAVQLELEIETSDLCWVSATADGQVVIYRLMQPGERVSIGASDAIALRVGNAAAFTYWINGARGRPLGLPGEVVTLDITPDNHQTVLATSAEAT